MKDAISSVLNIILRPVYNAGTHRIFSGFVYIVHLQFTKDIFTMSHHRVHAEITLGSYFLCCFSHGNGSQYLFFRSGQVFFLICTWRFGLH